MATARNVQTEFAAVGLELKKADLLLGTATSTPENDPDNTAAAALTAELESIIGVGKVNLANDGVRIVGTPVGTAAFAAKFVEEEVTTHSERLSNVLTLGLVSPQAGLLLIQYCCMTRLNYLMQSVPYCIAAVAYTTAYANIISVWREFMKISDADMDGHMVRELIAQPPKLGGQGLTNFQYLANSAFAGCMAAAASDLKQTVCGLHDFGDPGTPVPQWGATETVWEELAAVGDHVKAALPPLNEIYEDTTPRLQHAILDAIQLTTQEKLLADPGHPLDTRVKTDAFRALLLSRAQHGAMSWHGANPWSKNRALSPDQVRTIVRLELNMAQPGLDIGHVGCRLNGMAAEDHAKVVGHLALNTASTGLGGYYTSHDAYVAVLRQIGIQSGTVCTTSLSGVLGSLPGSNVDTRADLLMIGLDHSRNGMLIDVSITHPVTGKGKAKLQAAHVTGHASAEVLKTKVKRYRDLAKDAGFDLCFFVLETTGGLSQPAIDLLKRLAKHCADHTDIMRLSARDTRIAFAGRLHSQWLQALSIARARTIADRIRGASIQAIARVRVPAHNAAAGLSQEFL
jgi:hypothetical protein